MDERAMNAETLIGARLGVRAVGAMYALCAFAVAMVTGMVSGGEPDWVIGRGLIAMSACFILGVVAASAAQAAVRERLRELIGDDRSKEGAPADVSTPSRSAE